MVSISRGSVRLSCALALSSVLLFGCSDGSDKRNDIEQAKYLAEIVWTEFGIPHITAKDWGSLGYGSGYALARENYCTLMSAYVHANGESARYFGDEGNLNQDLVLKMFNDDAAVQRMLDSLPEFIRENLAGYVAGVNRYLRETGVDNLAEGEEGCRGGDWVREVSLEDEVRLIHMLMLYGSSLPLAPVTVAANPDNIVASREVPPTDKMQELLASVDPGLVRAALDMPTSEEMGSNAYAIGADASQTNSGLLFGNPHFPWQENRRFFMFHTTIPGEYDVTGAGLIGVPGPVIGYNQDVAWSHTVSTAQRFTFYELELNPENLLQYLYDGEYLDLDTRTVSAQELQADGSTQTIEHTFYLSRYGPIVDLGAIDPLGGGWPNAFGTLASYRDANLENMRGIPQWFEMGKAKDLGEFKEALRPMGIPWVNTIAADRYGDAFYGDISVTPHVSVTKYNDCVRSIAQTFLTSQGSLTMDGSDPDCNWGSDPDTVEGIFGYDSMPKLETREYGANANDSYWLSNPRMLLTGFSPVIGKEEIEQSLRTRHTFDQAERRLAGDDEFGDPGFNIDNIRQLHYRAANYAADLTASDVVAICKGVDDWSPYTDDPATVAQACMVLESWDTRHGLDSVGGHVFFEFWRDAREIANLWLVPFDPADAVNTPRQLNLADADVVEAVKQALADGVGRLSAAGIPVDRSWGETQFDEKNGERIGIHGGSGSMMFSVITSNLVEGEGYANITHGNSYIQAVTWDESDCPDAYSILTYSQSTDPASDHYADATKLYSSGEWIDSPFCKADIEAAEINRATISE